MTNIEHDFSNADLHATPADDGAVAAKRKRLFLGLAGGIALIGGGSYGYNTLIGSHHVVTDNAYVGADTAQVTPLVGGPVRDVLVQDTQQVRRGDVLVRLDDTDARIAVARAEAELASTIRRVKGLVATDSGLAAQVSARVEDERKAEAQFAAAHSEYDKARIDLQRREALAESGAVSGDELTSARNAFNTATANLHVAEAARSQAAAGHDAAIGSREANHVLIADTTVDNNPDVLAARAALDQARVDLERTVVRAPVDGVVSRRQVQVGQRVAARHAMLMIVVPIQAAYVDANFKEVQLAKVRPGQPVDADLRSLWRRCRLPRPRGRLLRRHRRGLRRRPGAERHRQLDQGGAAPAGAHRARSAANLPRTRCGSACR